MPPFVAAAEILASPIENRGMPQACDRPTLGLVAAGPADTGPFTKVIGATTGARPTAQPVTNTAQHTASVQTLNMSVPPPLADRSSLVANYPLIQDHDPHPASLLGIRCGADERGRSPSQTISTRATASAIAPLHS